jgi:hypothetical protein
VFDIPYSYKSSHSKRWRWTGQLAVGDNESNDGLAEPVGDIVLSDNTPLNQTLSELGIHLLFPSSMESLCLRHCYPLSTFQTVIADFQISQFARMTPNKNNQLIDQESSFNVLVTYMAKNEIVCLRS